jgi:hypothetical protein
MKTKMIALMSALLLSSSYAATSINYDIDTVLIGTVAPSNATPWGQITITESGSNSVLISVDSHLYNGAYYSSLGLNLADTFTFTPSTFQLYPTVGDFKAPTVSYGNNIGSGGAGIGYDIWFEFSTANRDGGAERFNMDDTFTYYVTGVNIHDFENVNNPVILHTQNLTGGVSSWTGTAAVPEPSAMLLGGIGMFFLLTKRRRA